jgi:hypothetical protein
VPNRDIAAVLERALDFALEQAQKQRFATTNRPRSSRTRMVKRASRDTSLPNDRASTPEALPPTDALRDHQQNNIN